MNSAPKRRFAYISFSVFSWLREAELWCRVNRAGPRKMPSPADRGIALLVTVIFMAVMLTFGLALASLAYKQSILAATAAESQNAFYTADAALECALYADQQQSAFLYDAHDRRNPPSATVCDGRAAVVTLYKYNAIQLTLVERMQLDNDTRCADVTVYKRANGRTYLFAQGYNVACSVLDAPSSARVASRGLDARY